MKVNRIALHLDQPASPNGIMKWVHAELSQSRGTVSLSEVEEIITLLTILAEESARFSALYGSGALAFADPPSGSTNINHHREGVMTLLMKIFPAGKISRGVGLDLTDLIRVEKRIPGYKDWLKNKKDWPTNSDELWRDIFNILEERSSELRNYIKNVVASFSASTWGELQVLSSFNNTRMTGLHRTEIHVVVGFRWIL